MIIFALSFLFGIFISFINYENLNFLTLPLILFFIVIFVIAVYKIRILFLIAGGFFGGLLLMFLRIDNYIQNEKLADNFSNIEILTSGQIISIPEQILDKNNSKKVIAYKFKFAVDNQQNFQIIKQNNKNKKAKNSNLNLQKIPSTLQVFYYKNDKNGFINFKLGDTLQLHLKLKSIHGNINDGSYNFDLKMMSENIGATAYIIQKNNLNKVLTNAKNNNNTNNNTNNSKNNLLFLVENLRYEIKQQILTLLPPEKFHLVGIIIGLAIGEQKAISPQQWELLNNTGVTHLFAISGLHITMFAIFAGGLTALIWKRFPLLVRFLPTKLAAIFISCIVAIFYALLSGFEIPAQRTLIMLLVVAISLFIKRKFSIFQILFTALFLVLLFDSFAIFAIGFWLSFMCVVALIIVGSSWLNNNEKNTKNTKNTKNNKSILEKIKFISKEYIITQTATCLITLPILLYIFQKFPLVSPISNLIAIPLVSFIITPLILFTTFFIFVFPKALLFYLLSFSHYLLQQLLNFLQFCNDNVILLEKNISAIALILSFCGIFILLLPKKFPGKLFAVFLLLPLFLEKSPRPNFGDAWVYFLDVGQNLSVVIKTQNKTIIYDVANERFAKSVILPFLRFHSINNIDLMIISHQDNDHSGGLNTLLENQNLNIKNVMTSMQNLPNSILCNADYFWEFDGVKFQTFNALQQNSTRFQPNFLDNFSKDIAKKNLQISWKNLQNQSDKNNYFYAGNDKSCVIKITTQNGKSVLLTGDIGKNEEQNLIQNYDEKTLQSDVLLVAHHGSLTSSAENFLQIISPKLAIISAGFDNKFNHPNPLIIQRLQKLNVPILQTQINGQISIKLDEL